MALGTRHDPGLALGTPDRTWGWRWGHVRTQRWLWGHLTGPVGGTGTLPQLTLTLWSPHSGNRAPQDQVSSRGGGGAQEERPGQRAQLPGRAGLEGLGEPRGAVLGPGDSSLWLCGSVCHHPPPGDPQGDFSTFLLPGVTSRGDIPGVTSQRLPAEGCGTGRMWPATSE